MKKMFIVLSVALLAACGKEKKHEEHITLTGGTQSQTLLWNDTVGSSNISFMAMDAWTSLITETDASGANIQTSPQWIFLDPSSGDKSGSYTVKILLKPNNSASKRFAKILFSCKGSTFEVKLDQAGTSGTENTMKKVRKINNDTVIYASDGVTVLQFGTERYTNKMYGETTWAYVSADSKFVCNYTYNSNNYLTRTDFTYNTSNAGFQAICSWSGNELIDIRGDQIAVSRLGFLKTILEYGNLQYSLGNIDINWLLASREYYTGGAVSAISVKTSKTNKLLVKKIQIEEQGEGKYNADITYRYVFDSDAYVSEIYETSSMNGGSEVLLYRLQY